METAEKTEQSDVETSQLRGETIAYAIQSGVYNLAANFFEPYISYRFQKHFSRGSAQKKSYGNYTQNLGGEFAGDIIGAPILMVAEAFTPEKLHYFTRSTRNFIDPLYDSIARYALSKECKEPDFEKRVTEWKVFQERNLIRSGIVMSAGIAGNLATQKWIFKNPSPPMHILEGKLLSTTITTAVGLATRFTFPKQIKKIDTWMGEQIAPYMPDKKIESLPTTSTLEIASITRNQQALQRL